jgi:hypothetical protein
MRVLARVLVLGAACSIAMLVLLRLECPGPKYDIRVTNRSGREVSSATLVVFDRRRPKERETLLIPRLEPDSSWDLVTKLANDVTYDAAVRWSDGTMMRDSVSDYLDSSSPESDIRIDSSGVSLERRYGNKP